MREIDSQVKYRYLKNLPKGGNKVFAFRCAYLCNYQSQISALLAPKSKKGLTISLICLCSSFPPRRRTAQRHSSTLVTADRSKVVTHPLP